MHPPSYQASHSAPTYPIYRDALDEVLNHEKLPLYKPASEGFGLVLVKRELVSPYKEYDTEWQPCFMELNSTQLNFYQLSRKKDRAVPSVAEIIHSFQAVCNTDTEKTPTSALSRLWKTTGSVDKRNLDSLFTMPYPATFHSIPSLIISQSPVKSYIIFTHQPVSSYTLQRAKIGVATDTQGGSPAVFLRARVETEQLLIQCFSEESLIDWYFKLNFAKDLSLPLELRLETTVRTIPRRRGTRYRGEGEGNLLDAVSGSQNRSSSGLNTKYDYSQVDQTVRGRANSASTTASDVSTVNSQFTQDSLSDFSECSMEEFEVRPSGLALTPGSKNYNLELSFIKQLMSSLKATDKWVGQPLVVSHKSPEARSHMSKVQVSVDSRLSTMRILGIEPPASQNLTTRSQRFQDCLDKTEEAETESLVWVLPLKKSAMFGQAKWSGSEHHHLACHEYIVARHGLVCL
ncbi:hypothetical protein BABINDRAFT_5643 [Babjeviella inositovora NRRL Y-12698]|uniref:PH domain-containing protein n=1 Tax=Babjeviella inositovora NRRL Y-12698 TaxID=984486 RepID=A0A1E3QYK9_9ASCO|nr:uncharacterized protein BABINDRAFT_5643 [Babjeviella inositovora NRRL Y-12698]ODQ82718.1 hypothetical protein BABINDRAFT_5643 [Babjeviella inositovora NRRL Y-12698]